MQYKTAFVLSHKLREAMASEIKGMQVGGAGKTVEIDGGYFGGYVKPANEKENRRDRRLAKNQNGKRQWSWSFASVTAGRCPPCSAPRRRVGLDRLAGAPEGPTVMADEAGSWKDLHAKYAVKRIDHGQLQHRDGAYTNGAEIFQPDAPGREGPPPPHRGAISDSVCAREAWREDHRRVDNGRQVQQIRGWRWLPAEVDFRGYWQRSKAA